MVSSLCFHGALLKQFASRSTNSICEIAARSEVHFLMFILQSVPRRRVRIVQSPVEDTVHGVSVTNCPPITATIWCTTRTLFRNTSALLYKGIITIMYRYSYVQCRRPLNRLVNGKIAHTTNFNVDSPPAQRHASIFDNS